MNIQEKRAGKDVRVGMQKKCTPFGHLLEEVVQEGQQEITILLGNFLYQQSKNLIDFETGFCVVLN